MADVLQEEGFLYSRPVGGLVPDGAAGNLLPVEPSADRSMPIPKGRKESILITVTLRQLQVFLAIAKTENVGTAAADLFMSKSAVSQALAELEAKLEVQLFDRNRGRIYLTAEGRRLMPQADEMVRRATDISELFRARKKFSQFRVGCTRTVGTFMIAELMKGFEDAMGWIPAVEIANTHAIAERLAKFELDIALIEGPVTDPELVTEPWLEDEMVVVAPKDHPLTGRPVSYDELNNVRWVLREEGSSSRNFFDTQLRQKLSSIHVNAELNSFDAIIRSVLVGLGLTYISRRVLTAPFYGRYLTAVELPDRFRRQLTFCRHADKYLSPDVHAWMNHCRAYAMRHGVIE